MLYEDLANAVMVLHILLITSVFVGILVSVRYKRFRPYESIILLLAIIIWSIYGGCPLTYAESSLRIYAGHPLPLTQNGFISFYLHRWFDLSVSHYQIIIATYFVAILFLAISIDWISPYINIEIFKLRESFGLVKRSRNSK